MGQNSKCKKLNPKSTRKKDNRLIIKSAWVRPFKTVDPRSHKEKIDNFYSLKFFYLEKSIKLQDIQQIGRNVWNL